MMRGYFRNLYVRTMREAYRLAEQEIISAMRLGGGCLDCGANNGYIFEILQNSLALGKDQYIGVDWNPEAVKVAQSKGINIIRGNLNNKLNFQNDHFQCISAISVLEHLLNPCQFLKECHRCLGQGGTLVLLTPNISTLFTIVLLILGKMPSSGPHPDSEALMREEEVFKVSDELTQFDVERDVPSHRHLVVFSYRVLKRYLALIGFKSVTGRGFGLYPFPNFMQKPLEKLNPYHCHQMVFVAIK